ncbi:putative signal peptide and transmembrane protein [Rhodopirellula islandica]|uniref:Signal peptide and transmembrane protein n=1 Tax=Rhodopirellula islandica TaxID=595434 RepID=A0A0J1BEB7_RHOIS|nr:DUF1592 domain-containing protein [Rhodopirellula islandica]KLU04928.1 putative signal peptide and transmembrane protein [Rhodopirellula islandica]
MLLPHRFRWLIVGVLFPAWCGVQAEEPQQMDPVGFLESYCIDCHTSDDPAGERDLESLNLGESGFDTQLLQEAIDELTLRSMPPEDGDQPSEEDRLAAVDALTQRLTQMRQEATSTNGRTVLRRLTRREYRETMSDLLNIDMTMFDPTLEFPADNLSQHFDNVGDTLVMSGHLLERYLDAADRCVTKAMGPSERPAMSEWSFRGKFPQQAELRTAHRRAFNDRFLCLYDHPFNDKTEGAYGHIESFSKGVPVDGTYEILVRVKAMHRDTPYSEQSVKIDLEEPFRLGIRPGDTRIGDLPHRQPIQPLLAESMVPDDEFEWIRFEVPLDRGFVARFTFENGMHDVRGSYARIYRMHRDLLPEKIRKTAGIFLQRIALISEGKIPHLRIEEVKVRGPIAHAWPTASQQALFGRGASGEEPWDEATVRDQIVRFATRAYRRPVTETEIAELVAFYDSRRALGQSSRLAYADTVKAILCSAAFLYFQTPDAESGQLSEHALAERLAYFLTSSMPDATLRRLADEGKLHDPETLRQQTRRLLDSEESDAFVADFLDNWLDLRSLGSMPPDPREFAFFYAGDLQVDMKRETQMFFRDLIDRDDSLTELLAASHSFLNRDLAKLYGVAEEFSEDRATEFRRFDFENSPGQRRLGRGGLLGQASILTVSANGIETSPVTRGVWLLENILGTPTPPPPDDVPTIEPDTRGAKTIRDQLLKHRENATCFQCHRKIDPLGFAMEGFDAIGQSRKVYDTKPRRPIDTSGELPGGAKFEGVEGLKQQLIKRQDFIARTVTERLLMHALGRRIEPSDRAAVDAMLKPLEDEGYPAAQLIESIVTSELFRR